MRDHCKLSFLSPTPRFRVSSRVPLARLLFYDIPKWRACSQAMVTKKLHTLNGFDNLKCTQLSISQCDLPFVKTWQLLVKSVCLQRQVQCTPLTIKNWPKQETARKKVSDCLTAWSIWPDLCSQGEIFIASIRREEEVMQFETLKNNS